MIRRYLTVSLVTNQCNIFLFMIIQVQLTQAHAITYHIKTKAPYCLITSWGATIVVRSPTATTTKYTIVKNFQLMLPSDLNGSIALLPDTLIFDGSRTLSQFNIMDTTFNFNLDDSRLHVDIKLKRIISYHLTNTYLPTITLLIIAEITLQFDKSKTELSAVLSLTIMLVMYTMYQSISAALVKTAYMKMVDYWLLFCLLMPFFIFMIEIYWLLMNKKELSSTENGWMADKQEITTNRKIVRRFVFAITLCYLIIYTLVSLAMSYDII